MLLTYCFCIGSVEEVLRPPYPFLNVFHSSFGRNADWGATTAFTAVILALLLMITVNALAVTSRQIFAFARDKGLPFHAQLGQLHHSVPRAAILSTAAYTSLLSLLNLATTTALYTVISLATVALQTSYLISIACMISRRLRNEPLPFSKWSLGRYGLPVNIMAMLYTSYSIFWSLWPAYYKPTARNFNWAVVILAGLMAAALALYVFGMAGKEYQGPVGGPSSRIGGERKRPRGRSRLLASEEGREIQTNG
ncbi:hypothetical protein MBLNU230_g1788t1 [Neophaeotheca triangularis]